MVNVSKVPQFVVVRTWRLPGTPAGLERFPSSPKTRDEALHEFKLATAGVWENRSLYGPHTGNRVAVMAEAEWLRVVAGGAR
jgi:hypothetical protein